MEKATMQVHTNKPPRPKPPKPEGAAGASGAKKEQE